MTSLAVCQSLINYYLAAAGRLFAVFAFGGWRATFSRFRLAVSVGAVRAVLFFSAFRRFFLCGLRRSGDFLPFALAFRACVLRVLRCLRFPAGGRFSQFKVQTFGPQRSSKSAALEYVCSWQYCACAKRLVGESGAKRPP